MRLTPQCKNGPRLRVNVPVLISSTSVPGGTSVPGVRTKSKPAIKNVPWIVLLGLLVTSWGCAKPGENRQAASSNEPARSTASSPQGGSASNTPAASTNAPAAVAIATADGEKGGTRVDITELKRTSDNNLTLKFVIVNDSAERFNFGYDFADPDHSVKDISSVGGVTLVDGANKKKYFVVRDTENSCLCSRDLKDLQAHTRANVWAKFPPPPDDVQKISVVIPHFGPLDDVPISR
jgi:hypothetical protein